MHTVIKTKREWNGDFHKAKALHEVCSLDCTLCASHLWHLYFSGLDKQSKWPKKPLEIQEIIIIMNYHIPLPKKSTVPWHVPDQTWTLPIKPKWGFRDHVSALFVLTHQSNGDFILIACFLLFSVTSNLTMDIFLIKKTHTCSLVCAQNEGPEVFKAKDLDKAKNNKI